MITSEITTAGGQDSAFLRADSASYAAVACRPDCSKIITNVSATYCSSSMTRTCKRWCPLSGQSRLWHFLILETKRVRPEDGHSGTASARRRRTAHPNRALMAGEKTAHDPEAQSGSLLGLSRKKGFKNSRQNGSGNARARVGNGEAYTVDRGVPPASRRVHRDGQASAARHGFDRIQQQVVDDLAHFVGKTQDGLSFGDFSSDSNAPAVKFSAEYLQGLVDG